MSMTESLVGSPTFAAGRFGSGITGLSDASYVLLPRGAWPASAPFTVEAWLSIAGTEIAVAVSSEWWMGLDLTGNFAAFMSGAYVDSGIKINDGAWHHCAFVVADGVLTLFVDGVQGPSAPVNYTAPSIQPVIGRLAPFNGFPWTGTIDEVAIWSYAKYTGSYSVPNVPYTGAEPHLIGLYHLEGNVNNSAGAVAPLYNVIDPTNPAILYSPFNWSVTPGYARTICGGAYFRTIFSGTSISLYTDTTPNAAPFAQLWVKVDNQGWVQHSLASGSPTILVATGLPNGKHMVEVMVKATTQTLSRWISSETIVQITGLLLDQGGTVASPLRRTKNILIFGDSITEGTNAITTTSSVDVDRADALGCYSYALATALDAEVGIVAFGGSGINSWGSVPPLIQSYNYLYGWIPRSFSGPAPDVVIYNEGTNDAGSITQGLMAVVTAILSVAPNSKHLLLNPFNGSHTIDLQEIVFTLNTPSVVYQSTKGWFNPVDSIDTLHPYNYAHVQFIAPRLYPVVSALMSAAASSAQQTASVDSVAAGSGSLYAFR